MHMTQVFISYGREDQEKVRSLAQDIEALGYQVWFDGDLTGGQAWWDCILSEIQNCDIFVFALAPASLDSLACKGDTNTRRSLPRAYCRC